MRWVGRRCSCEVWEWCRWGFYALLLGVLVATHFGVGSAHYQEPWERNWFSWRASDREEMMYRYLAGDDPLLAQRAAAALWDHWFSERGPRARQRLENGLAALRAGELAQAEAELLALMAEHPGWAEAINAVAMVRYRQRRYAESAQLCRRVLELKPRHFGAWSGLAHSAIHERDWALARYACRQALRIQPHEAEHRRVLNFIELHIPSLDV